MSDLHDLKKRVDEAKGPDRELDAGLAKVAGWKLWRSKHGYWNVEGPDGERFTTETDPYGPKFDPDTGKANPYFDKEPVSWIYDTEVPNYTDSLDAAISLVEKMGLAMHMIHFGRRGASASVCPPDNAMLGSDGDGATAPLAVLSALLTALSEKVGESGE